MIPWWFVACVVGAVSFFCYLWWLDKKDEEKAVGGHPLALPYNWEVIMRELKARGFSAAFTMELFGSVCKQLYVEPHAKALAPDIREVVLRVWEGE